jgi:hypothetical protein
MIGLISNKVGGMPSEFRGVRGRGVRVLTVLRVDRRGAALLLDYLLGNRGPPRGCRGLHEVAAAAGPHPPALTCLSHGGSGAAPRTPGRT